MLEADLKTEEDMHAISLALLFLPALACPQELSLKTSADGLYEVEGSFEAPVDVEAAWALLSAYDGLAGVVDSLRSSRVLERGPAEALVEQVAVGGFLFFSKKVTVLLKIRELKPLRIDFEERSKAQFRTYRGSWELLPLREGVKVSYRLFVSQGDLAPGPLEQWLFKREAHALLGQLRAELIRRKT
jgi:hypothetical protein